MFSPGEILNYKGEEDRKGVYRYNVLAKHLESHINNELSFANEHVARINRLISRLKNKKYSSYAKQRHKVGEIFITYPRE